MGVSNYANSQASYTTGGGQWNCPQCGVLVNGSHICHSTVFPAYQWQAAPKSPLTDEEMRELLELVRELHEVIFRPSIKRDVLTRDGEDEE